MSWTPDPQSLRGRIAVVAGANGFTDIDGSQPNSWKYTENVEAGRDADPESYR
jgi:hypothetical protein